MIVHSGSGGSRTGHRCAAVVTSLVLSQGGLPVAYRAAVVPDGVEPSFPGCGPSVVAVGPRDRMFKWSHRESHPDLQRAELAPSCWTMTPRSLSAEAVGLEPTSDSVAAACLPSRFLTNSDGFRYRCSPRRKPWDSNPQAAARRHLFSRQAPYPAGWLPRQAAGAGIEPT